MPLLKVKESRSFAERENAKEKASSSLMSVPSSSPSSHRRTTAKTKKPSFERRMKGGNQHVVDRFIEFLVNKDESDIVSSITMFLAGWLDNTDSNYDLVKLYGSLMDTNGLNLVSVNKQDLVNRLKSRANDIKTNYDLTASPADLTASPAASTASPAAPADLTASPTAPADQIKEEFTETVRRIVNNNESMFVNKDEFIPGIAEEYDPYSKNVGSLVIGFGGHTDKYRADVVNKTLFENIIFPICKNVAHVDAKRLEEAFQDLDENLKNERVTRNFLEQLMTKYDGQNGGKKPSLRDTIRSVIQPSTASSRGGDSDRGRKAQKNKKNTAAAITPERKGSRR